APKNQDIRLLCRHDCFHSFQIGPGRKPGEEAASITELSQYVARWSLLCEDVTASDVFGHPLSS
ncbi:hypothetical protein, partial [Pararobbsia alpina]|uniref:hypothetical protein n=1 Tax=Pararobbsia alpina TaxID=621374 RepID=UPI001C2EED80